MTFPIRGASAVYALAFVALYAPNTPAVDLKRADAHAPIGVMADHTHEAGEVMFSYRYMYMDMDGSRDGTSDRNDREVLAAFPITPTKMQMTMHMLGAMYAPTDDLTLMAMVPALRGSMNHVNRMGVHFTTHTEAIGDTKLTGLFRLTHDDNSQLHLNLGVSLPTGDINVKDNTPLGRVRLPYPMQAGSGSFELLPGITWVQQAESWSAGAQALGTFRLDDNRKSYRLGPKLELNAWGSYLVSQQLSGSLRLRFTAWGNIHGADRTLNPRLVPTADPDRRAGRVVDLGVGFNWLFTDGALKGNRIAAEVLLPLYRWLDGPQLETDTTLVLGWQRAF